MVDNQQGIVQSAILLLMAAGSEDDNVMQIAADACSIAATQVLALHMLYGQPASRLTAEALAVINQKRYEPINKSIVIDD